MEHSDSMHLDGVAMQLLNVLNWYDVIQDNTFKVSHRVATCSILVSNDSIT